MYRMLSHELLDATPEQMQAAFQLRRLRIVSLLMQLQTDVDSYNENQNKGEPIRMVMDFRNDVLEAGR